MRIGVFGGSFDPIHHGHLRLADACAAQARLDRVRFTPAARQPLKPLGPICSDDDRAAMLRLAIAEHPEYELSTIELDRGGMSFTADTLAEMHCRNPADELFFLMGADALGDFAAWSRPEEICKLATLLVVSRPESTLPDMSHLDALVRQAGGQFSYQVVEMPKTPISSTQIRRQIVASDARWKESVPAPVAAFIERHELYGAGRQQA